MKIDPESRKTDNLKKIIRKRIQKKRDSLSDQIRLTKSKAIAAKFIKLGFYKDSKKIIAYFPFRSEIDTTIIIRKALRQQKKVLLPRVNGKDLDLYYIKDLSKDLGPGSFGIMEPVPAECIPASYKDIDLVLIPGVGFDRQMNRLGYGGGFYDKLLKILPADLPRIAIAFDLQIVDSIPIMAHDLKIDIIVTETEIITSNYYNRTYPAKETIDKKGP
ncbi:MAG: 5-formyltetrahydrofolate cyclo-ligase [Actinobacteria bacterium]|nr:5-formyltetrahydrofolate cyclo-ligase [Actinomycetota bacterium]